MSLQTVVRGGLFISMKAIIDGDDREVGTELEWWLEEKNYLGVEKVAKRYHDLHHKWRS